jgi:predicted ATPase/ATP/maltotriose-dependent transcriptional regulator MalT
MARGIPKARDGSLQQHTAEGASIDPIPIGTAEWYSWLEQHRSFCFEAGRVTFTARKEQRSGGRYWYAYRRSQGKLRTSYLGKSEELTIERLTTAAHALEQAGDAPDGGTHRPPGAVKVPVLPVPLTPFIGREQEAASAAALLRRPEIRLVTMWGVAGIGKTRLAIQVAADLFRDFADGVAFVSLAPIRDSTLVLATVAHTLGLPDSGNKPRDSLCTFLRNKHLLLVLDNFEQVMAAASDLVDLLSASPHLKLLVTSREVLHLQVEQQFAVPPLALPNLAHLPESDSIAQYPAVKLFIHRAQAVQHDFQVTPTHAPLLAQICTRLEGLPLALELAAARVRLLPPAALLARLDRRLDVLSGGGHDLPERQRTLRATLAWSYELLSARERRLFRRLSVFVGGFTLEAAKAVSKLSDETEVEAVSTLDAVASLLDKSFLQQGKQEGKEPRLLMLETIREYGVEALLASGEMEAVRQAHAAYFLHLAETAEPALEGPHPAIWWDRLEREQENLRAAMQWFLEREEGALALRLGCALWWFWHARGLAGEGRSFLEQALTRSEEVAGALRAKALYVVGNFAAQMGDFDQAEACCKESLALFQESGDRKKVGHVLSHLGFIAVLNSELGAARTYFEEGLVVAREVEDKMGIGWPLWWLAHVNFLQGEYLKGLTLAEEALAFFQEAENVGAIAQTLWLLAHIHFYSQGNVVKAQALVEESLALAREMNDSGQSVNALVLLVRIARHQGKIALAHSLLGEIQALGSEAQETLGMSYAIYLALFEACEAQVEACEGDYLAAQAHYEESVAGLKNGVAKWDMALSLEGLAGVAAAQGADQWAAHLWAAAATVRDAIGVPMPPLERADYERAVVVARLRLGEKAWDSAWEEGRTMTPEQALASQAGVPASKLATPLPMSSFPAFPDGLTAREVEVLRSVSQGLTDAQVADQLVISPRTVQGHLRSIYNKINVASRSAATRYAVEQKLV